MELRHLRYFVALADCLSFTRAAERVHVTQSTLSHQIRKLEEELGYVLFDRAPHHVALTESGKVFLEFAENALREVDRGLGALKKGAAEATGPLRIGATNTFNRSFIPRCVATFLGTHPGGRVAVEELSADAIRAKLYAGELDVGIAYRPAEPSDLCFEPLHHEEMVLAVAPGHVFAGRARVRMVELDRQPLVLLPRSFATRTMLDECFRTAGAEPVVCAEMNTIAPMLELVAQTGIGTIVGIHALSPPAGLCTVALAHPTPVRIPGILWRRDAEMTAPMRSFLAIVRSRAGSRKAAGSEASQPSFDVPCAAATARTVSMVSASSGRLSLR
jgi:LysR family cyn operon transcriptional activator